MKKIVLTDREKVIIRGWANDAMCGGHWGDGNVETVDEAITLEAINAPGQEIVLRHLMVRLILIWAEAADVEVVSTPEEGILIEKLKELNVAFNKEGV